MSELDLGLRQLDVIPGRTTVLVSGTTSSGKTTFAAWASRRALSAGQKVAFIDADHSFRGNCISSAIIEMCQTPGAKSGLLYLALADAGPFQVAKLVETVREVLDSADLIVVDELPRAIRRAADATGQTEPGAILARISDMVKKSARQPVLLVTYTVSRSDLARMLPAGVPTETDPVFMGSTRLLPVVTEQRSGVINVEMHKVRRETPRVDAR